MSTCVIGAKMIGCCESVSEEVRAQRMDVREFKRASRAARAKKIATKLGLRKKSD